MGAADMETIGSHVERELGQLVLRLCRLDEEQEAIERELVRVLSIIRQRRSPTVAA